MKKYNHQFFTGKEEELNFQKFMLKNINDLENLSRNDLAYYLLKRNPVYIKITLEWEKIFKSFNKNKISKINEILPYLCAELEFEEEQQNLIKIEEIKKDIYFYVKIVANFDNKQLNHFIEFNYCYERLFGVHHPEYIMNDTNNTNGSKEKTHTKLDLMQKMFNNQTEKINHKFALAHSDNSQLYTDAFNHKIYKNLESSYTSDEIKNNNSLFLDDLFSYNKYDIWLKRLQPSISININPFNDKKVLRKQIDELVKLINDKDTDYLSNFATPDFLIDATGEKEENLTSYLKRPSNKTFQYGIFLFDMIFVFKFELEYIYKLFTIIFSEYEADSIFSIDNKRNNIIHNTYKIRGLSKLGKDKLNTVKDYIFNSYLELIYPPKTYKLHFEKTFSYLKTRSNKYLENLSTPKNYKKYKPIIFYTEEEKEKEFNQFYLVNKTFDEEKKIFNNIFDINIDFFDIPF